MASLLMVDNSVSGLFNFRPDSTTGQVIFNNSSARNAGWIEVVGIVPQVSGTLYGFLNAATSNVDIYDTNGDLIAQRNNTTNQPFAPVIANERYYLAISSTVTVAINTSWLTVQMYETPTVTESFEGGFVTNQPFINGITSSTDANGVLTYTFNAVALTLGQTTGLNLGFTGLALKTGTITMTSSDSTVFPNVSDGFVPNVVFQFQFQSLKTTVFTGTIVVSVTGAGILGPVYTVPVGILGGGFKTTNVKLKRARKILRSITPGIVDSSKKKRTDDDDDEDSFITADV